MVGQSLIGQSINHEVEGHQAAARHTLTGMGKRIVPRLRELATRGQRESGGGIHAT